MTDEEKHKEANDLMRRAAEIAILLVDASVKLGLTPSKELGIGLLVAYTGIAHSCGVPVEGIKEIAASTIDYLHAVKEDVDKNYPELREQAMEETTAHMKRLEPYLKSQQVKH